jgi:hypothetical protein
MSAITGPTSGSQGHGVQPRPPERSTDAVPDSPNLTPWSEEQKREWDARKAIRDQHWGKTFLEMAGTLAERDAAARARAADQEAQHRANWGDDPRVALRTAHAALRDARGELRHRRKVLARAADLAGAKRTAHHDAAAVQAGVDARLRPKSGGSILARQTPRRWSAGSGFRHHLPPHPFPRLQHAQAALLRP